MSRRYLAIAVGCALLALLSVGVYELPGRSSGNARVGPRTPLSAWLTRVLLAGSPAPLAALHAQGDMLLEGGAPALVAQRRALQGWPVVIDKWASWCASCQAERTIFQLAAAKEGRRVAFLGIDSGDHSKADALAFLHAAPPSYPSYWDPSQSLGEIVTDSSFTPVTVFYTAGGARFIHQGPYESVAELERDVERYALA